jgi:5-hydroxyisourate hydrolase
MHVVLELMGARDEWSVAGRGVTDGDGRLRTLLPSDPYPGIYRLVFDTRGYFEGLGTRAFFPHVTITFTVSEGESHYHVPLLLSPFGYSTYRGS